MTSRKMSQLQGSKAQEHIRIFLDSFVVVVIVAKQNFISLIFSFKLCEVIFSSSKKCMFFISNQVEAVFDTVINTHLLYFSNSGLPCLNHLNLRRGGVEKVRESYANPVCLTFFRIHPKALRLD